MQGSLLCAVRHERPPSAAFTTAGFHVTVISEPAVAPATPRELLPDDIADGRRFLGFLFSVVQAD